MRKRIIATIAIIALVLSFSACSGGDASYKKTIEGMGLFSNNVDSALPQTEVYNIVMKHFQDTQTDLTKKLAFIAIDGARVDVLANLTPHKGLLRNGAEGSMVLSFAGGVKPGDQDTSTAPGWVSILTGEWAGQTGVYSNKDIKEKDAPTFMSALAEQGKSGAVFFEWGVHYDTTYMHDIILSINNGLPLTYEHIECNSEKETEMLYAFLRSVNSDIDVTVGIFELCDAAGHSRGFSNRSKRYVQAIQTFDDYVDIIVDAIKARDSYNEEDWLILITTDHGGIRRKHGGKTLQERMTFISSNKVISIK